MPVVYPLARFRRLIGVVRHYVVKERVGPAALNGDVAQLYVKHLAGIGRKVQEIGGHIAPGTALGEVRELSVVKSALVKISHQRAVQPIDPHRRRMTAHLLL